MRWLKKLLVLGVFASSIQLAYAASEGFHYVPLRMNSSYWMQESPYRDVESNLILAYLGSAVYRGTGNESFMMGIGAMMHHTWLQSGFVALSPQYGFNLFLGAPEDASGDARGRLSLQSPLGLHYLLQLYRDDRLPVGKMGESRNLGLYAGVLTPMTFDFTIDSFASAIDLGGQLGLAYSHPLPLSVLQVSAAVSKFVIGAIYLSDNDTVDDGWDDVDGEPVDWGVGVKYLYFPWHLAFGGDVHFTSSLGDTQGDSITLFSFNITYFPTGAHK